MSAGAGGDSVNLSRTFPDSTLRRVMEEALPEGVGVAKETVTLLRLACAEFVQLVASEANEVASKRKEAK